MGCAATRMQVALLPATSVLLGHRPQASPWPPPLRRSLLVPCGIRTAKGCRAETADGVSGHSRTGCWHNWKVEGWLRLNPAIVPTDFSAFSRFLSYLGTEVVRSARTKHFYSLSFTCRSRCMLTSNAGQDGASKAALLTCHAVAHSSSHCVTRLGKAQQRLGLLCRMATTQSLCHSSASPGLECSCQPIKFTAQAPSGRSNRPV
jgi:hypothetical protein